MCVASIVTDGIAFGWQFGDLASKLDYTECSGKPSPCDSLKIEAYPTWERAADKKRFEGFMALDELAKWADCPVIVPIKKNA